MKIEFTYTDAIYYDGQISANGCWAHRSTVEMPSNSSIRSIMRKGRQEFGLTGIRGRMLYDDMWKPDGMMTMLYFQIVDDE